MQIYACMIGFMHVWHNPILWIWKSRVAENTVIEISGFFSVNNVLSSKFINYFFKNHSRNRRYSKSRRDRERLVEVIFSLEMVERHWPVSGHAQFCHYFWTIGTTDCCRNKKQEYKTSCSLQKGWMKCLTARIEPSLYFITIGIEF